MVLFSVARAGSDELVKLPIRRKRQEAGPFGLITVLYCAILPQRVRPYGNFVGANVYRRMARPR